MAYTKQTWNNGRLGGTPISASRLNYMEEGIKKAHELSNDGDWVSGGAAEQFRIRLDGGRVTVFPTDTMAASYPAWTDPLPEDYRPLGASIIMWVFGINDTAGTPESGMVKLAIDTAGIIEVDGFAGFAGGSTPTGDITVPEFSFIKNRPT